MYWDMEAISLQEFKEAMKALKNRKATGSTEVKLRLLKMQDFKDCN